MTSIVDTRKKKQQVSAEEEDENNTQNISAAAVTSRIQLKQPANSGDTLDKDVVLRRIRHRRRVNKLKSTVKAFLGFASSYNKDKDKHKQTAVNSQMISWADDAFAAP